MKKKMFMLLMLLPLFAHAQDADDAKYLAGAVTEVNGKVEFTAKFAVNGHSKTDVYNCLKRWCEGLTTRPDVIEGRTRLAYTNPDEGELAVTGEEYLVFSNSALSLDRTRIYYNLRVLCEEGTYTLQLMRLRYLYDENRNGGERYNAEDIITDEMALNKNKTKLTRAYRKFRVKTIDLKDELFASASRAFGETTIRNARVVTSQTAPVSAATHQQAQPEVSVPVVATAPETVTPPVATPAVPQPTTEQQASFTLEAGSQACEMLKASDKITLTMISKTGSVSLMEFSKKSTSVSADGKSCTFTGKVSNQNVN